MVTDDRAVSITLTYVLTIAITTVLVAGLVVASTNMVDSHRNDAAEEELSIIGERLASEIALLERTATTDHPRTIQTTHASQAGGMGYVVSVTACEELYMNAGSDDCLHLQSQGSDAEVFVPLKDSDERDVEAAGGSVQGGAIDVAYEDGDITLREGRR